MNRMELFVDRHYRSVDLHAFRHQNLGASIRAGDATGALRATPPMWVPYDENDASVLMPDPLLRLSYPDAQLLLDQLVQCGIRPSGDGVGAMGATERHLADMRKIAFGLMQEKGITLA